MELASICVGLYFVFSRDFFFFFFFLAAGGDIVFSLGLIVLWMGVNE